MSTCISSSGCLLSFCLLGRGEERGPSFQFPPTMPQLLGSTSAGHGQPLPGWESPQGPCQRGRQADSAGWLAQAHSSEADCPTEMDISGEVGPTSSLPGLAISSISQMRAGWALPAEVGDSPVGLVPRAKGHYDSLAFLPLKIQVPQPQCSDFRILKISPLSSYTLAAASDCTL